MSSRHGCTIAAAIAHKPATTTFASSSLLQASPSPLTLKPSAVRINAALTKTTSFHTSTTSLNAATSARLRAQAKEQYEEWAENEADTYRIDDERGLAKMSSLFVNGSRDRPFPMNPYYIARPPVSDKTKTIIYTLYAANPREWTPRKLGVQFGISIVRVQAILRLKAVEMKLEE
ncbi:hypothetical protein HK102_012455, partial [Quaeritorhiza haematococci]